MKFFLPYSTLIILLATLLGAAACKKSESPPPLNFVFILVDDLGWTDLSCYGSAFHETPNLDRFAKESMLFTNAYAAASICSPTRAAIMSGKNPVRVDITDWIPGNDPKNRPLLGPQDRNELALEETTLAEAIKNSGYKTFFAGKWHLGDEGFFPEDQGFDINKGGHHRGSPPGGYYAPYKNPRLSNGPDGEYLPDRLTDESIRFIEQNRDSSFFLFLSFYTVHTPIQASRRHLAKFEAKAKNLTEPDSLQVAEGDGLTLTKQVRPDYASMVYAMDENVGRLLDKLKETGLYDNTVVIFTSDNGGLSTLPPRRNIAPTSVRPLRAGKGWLYEGGIRVPLIIRAPGLNIPGKNDAPAISYDFYPTILSLAGLPPMPSQHIDGLDLSPLLKKEGSFDRENLYWHYPHYHGSAWKPGAAIRSGKWKMVEFHENGETELYNLEEDLGETKNLAREYPEKLEELKQKLHDWQRDTGAKFAQTNPNFTQVNK